GEQVGRDSARGWVVIEAGVAAALLRVPGSVGPVWMLQELRKRVRRLPGQALQLQRVEANVIAQARSDDLEPLAVSRLDLPDTHVGELVRDLRVLPTPDGRIVGPVGHELRLRLRAGLDLSPALLLG